MIEQKPLENLECFKYLGSMLTNDGQCNCEIKYRIAMAQAALNKMRASCKKLVQCYVWSIALYGAETLMFQAVNQKHLESFEMWCWRMEMISWTNHVRNE
jgi:hypothetical protein